ncbi:MAG TPA: lysophospholipid acyltransferase family protein [Thermoanaerobaculia bacterium]|nr:lysophospholipid acyltransferase family protein [Thermoanaerobaculia bacterium]
MNEPDTDSPAPASEPPNERARKRARRRRWLTRAVPLIRTLVKMIWASLRIETIGLRNALDLVESDKPFIPCYWHGHQFVCVRTMLELQKLGLKSAFLISPSADGEIGAKLLDSFDVRIIRGSSTRTGAQALRDLYKAVSTEGISPITLPDGPRGPIHQFKPGAVILAQLTGAPIVPITFAARRTWRAGSWDRLLVPKPFTRVVVAIGEPRYVPKVRGKDDGEMQCREMERVLSGLEAKAAARLDRGKA